MLPRCLRLHHVRFFLLSLAMFALSASSRAQTVLPVEWNYAPIGDVTAAAYSPDGSHLAVASGPDTGQGAIQIYSAATNAFVRSLPTAAQASVNSIAFSPDGTKLADGGQAYIGSSGATIGVTEIWNVSTGKLLFSLQTTATNVFSVAFSPDGKSLADSGYNNGNGNSGVLELWNSTTGALKQTLPTAVAGYGPSALAFSPDGKTLAHCGGYQKLEIWTLATGAVSTLSTNATAPNAVAFSPDGKTLVDGGQITSPSGSTTGVLELWNLSTATATSPPTASLPTAGTVINSVAFSSDDKTIAAACGGTSYGNKNLVVELWDAPSASLDNVFSAGVTVGNAVAFSPDGKSLLEGGYGATGDQGIAQVWNVAAGTLVADLNTFGETPQCVAFSADGKHLASGGYTTSTTGQSLVGVVMLWDATTGAAIGTITTSASYVTSVAFSPDGATLAIAGTTTEGDSPAVGDLELWNVASQKLIATLSTPATELASVVFSPDGKFLVDAGGIWIPFGGPGGGVLEVRDLQTGVVTTLSTQIGTSVNAVSFSPDGSLLADGGIGTNDSTYQGIVELWNLTSGSETVQLSNNDISSLLFSPDGTSVVDCGGTDIEAWKIQNGALPSFPKLISSSAYSIGYSPNDQVLFGQGGSLVAYDAATFGTVNSFSFRGSALAISPSTDQLALASSTEIVVIPNLYFSKVAVSALTLNPTEVQGGGTSTGTVTLAAAAPAGGDVVGLSSASPFVIVPPTVTVPAGKTSATFPISTELLTGSLAVPITATSGAANAGATLTVTTLLSSISVSPASVLGGTASTGTVTLTGAAPAGGLTISLSSNSASAKVPASVTIGSGSSSATFNIATSAVSSLTTVTITAKSGTISQSATVTIQPAKLQAMALSASSVIGGSTTAVTGTVTLSGPAGPNGTSVALTSSNPTAATVPASVTVKAGATTASFAVTSLVVASNTTAKISAKLSGSTTQTQTLTVDALKVTGLSLDPTSVIGGSSSTGTVTLSAPVAHAVSVPLTVSSTDLGVPKTVSVSAKASTATFTVTTKAVAATTTGTVTATLGGASKSSNLSIKAAGLDTNSLNPTTVTGGSSSTGTVTLTGPAPSGGFKISLSSSNSAAQTPATVTVAAGKTSATYKVTTSQVKKTTTSLIEALVGSIHRTVKLTISP